MKFPGLKEIAAVVIGVLIAGLLMSWGYKNDIPGLEQAHGGYDS